MATEVVLHPDPQLFPVGTKVKVKVAPTLWPAPGSGEPAGTLVTEPTVAAVGTLTVTGLTEGTRYVGYANVGGVDHYLSLTPDIAPPVATGISAWKNSINNAAGLEYSAGFSEIWRTEGAGGIVRFRGKVKMPAGKSVAANSLIVAYGGTLKPNEARKVFVFSETKSQFVECELTTGGELKTLATVMAELETWSLDNVLCSLIAAP